MAEPSQPRLHALLYQQPEDSENASAVRWLNEMDVALSLPQGAKRSNYNDH